MNIKKWEVCHLDKDRAARLAEEYAIPFFLAMLLDIRGLTQPEDIQAVLGGEAPLSDPFQMKGMDQAVERIRQAIEGFERIAVYGDYDADGVTATAMLYTYLEAVGADVLYYIPQREGEGYGMNRHAVETLHQEGVKLIITVDNGISSLEEVALARELGMDVVITDHHRPHESLPDAAALIDAHQPGDQSPCKDLSGAGVVLKLLTALEDGDSQGILEEYADLAALGTIGDVVPLLGENRTIVKAGLRLIGQGGRPGVDALLEQSAVHREPTATTLAFTAIPRINATGRMGAPERAVRLLTCEEEEDAAGLAAEICGGERPPPPGGGPDRPGGHGPHRGGPPAAPQPGAGGGRRGLAPRGHRHCGLPHYRAVRQALLRHLRGRGGGPGQRPQRGGLLPVRGGVLLRGLPAALRRAPHGSRGHHAAGGCGPLPGGP